MTDSDVPLELLDQAFGLMDLDRVPNPTDHKIEWVGRKIVVTLLDQFASPPTFSVADRSNHELFSCRSAAETIRKLRQAEEMFKTYS